ITQIDKSGRKLSLSIKALEVEEVKKAMQEYGSSDSGASLGDILGAALKEKQAQAAAEGDDEKPKKAAAKKKAAKKDETEEAEEGAE
ncbi:MAG: hypothetical protein RLN77_04265, partial [Rhodospirillales bacterium]